MRANMPLQYVKPEIVSLRNHPQYNEAWLKERIIEDPTLLGLGDVDVKDVERRQPHAGRLDLLLQDDEAQRRYEVELMLGAVNESHIIRCIEYWDIERKRYPQYEHVAVIIAEDITTRFLNVIGLFNGAIPMVAIQLKAIRAGANLCLHFTKVLDEVVRGDDDEDSGGSAGAAPVDRDYWEERASRESLVAMDYCFTIIKELDPSLNLKLNKFYVGLADQFRTRNFVVFHPKRQFVRVSGWVIDSKLWSERLSAAGFQLVGSPRPGGSVRFRLTLPEAERNRDLMREFFGQCLRDSANSAGGAAETDE